MGFLKELVGRGLVRDLTVGPADNPGQQEKEPGIAGSFARGVNGALREAARSAGEELASGLIRDLTRPWGGSEETKAQESTPASPSKKTGRGSPKRQPSSQPSVTARKLSLSNQPALPTPEQEKQGRGGKKSSRPGQDNGPSFGKIASVLASLTARGAIGTIRTARNAFRELRNRRAKRNISPYEAEQTNDPDAGLIIDAEEWTVK